MRPLWTDRAALAAEERVELVDDDVPQAGEQGRDLLTAHDEQRLERLGRDEQGASAVVQQALVRRAGHVAMPSGDVDVQVLAQRFKPAWLETGACGRFRRCWRACGRRGRPDSPVRLQIVTDAEQKFQVGQIDMGVAN
jgi:hypothetical protein